MLRNSGFDVLDTVLQKQSISACLAPCIGGLTLFV